MAATSVTGKGRGSADGKNKGSAHMTLGVNNLIGPRIIVAGKATSSGGTVAVDLDPVSGADTDYVVIVTDTHATVLDAASGTFDASTGTLTLKGTDAHVLAYAIVKVGVA
jgi:hypothetical protein